MYEEIIAQVQLFSDEDQVRFLRELQERTGQESH